MIDIFKTIRDERKDFLHNEVEIVPGYLHSQYSTVKKIHLYQNSHYVDGDYEEINGVERKKIFQNISQWRCEVATKMLDLDVKDFLLVGENPENDINVFLLEKELKYWLKKHKLGKLLNQIVEELPVYGSVVLEKVKGGAELVDLRFMYNDQGAESLQKARYINIKSYMTLNELRKMKGKWKNVEDAIERFGIKQVPSYDAETGAEKPSQAEGVPLVEVWKRYGEVPKSWITKKEKDEDEWVLAKFIVCGIDSYQKNEQGVIMEEDGIELWSEQLTELPLKEVHYTRTKGRWLGVGIIEKLFEEQRRTNEIKNQKAQAMEIASLTIYQSQDQTIAKNVSTDLQNGQIIKVKSLITPIPTEARDLVAFENEEKILDTHSDRLTFSYDVIRGEDSPASTTLGAVQLQATQAENSFKYKRENIGLFLGEFIKDIVFPELKHEINKEHILRFAGSLGDLKKIRDLYTKHYVFEKECEYILNGRIPPERPQLEQEAVVALQGDKIWIFIEEDMFKDLDYSVDLVITDENKNLAAQLQNSQGLLALLQDPDVLVNPAKKVALFKALSAIGMHTSELDNIEQEAAKMPIPMEQMPQMQQMTKMGSQMMQ